MRRPLNATLRALRAGFSLIEVMVALLIVSGIMLAITQLLEELKLHPEHPEARRDLGLLYAQRDPKTPAEATARVALEHFLRALAAGLVDGEVDAYIALYSLWPEFVGKDPLIVHGESVPLHDRERALRHAELALERAPDNPRALFTVSTVLYLEDRFDEAIELLERTLALQPWREHELTVRIEGFKKRAAAAAPDVDTAADTAGDADTADEAGAEPDSTTDTPDEEPPP